MNRSDRHAGEQWDDPEFKQREKQELRKFPGAHMPNKRVE
jgi:hypothetical protein